MLLDETVKINITPRNRKYYADLGYAIPVLINNQASLIVDTSQLPKGSRVEVRVKCDYCGEETDKEYRHYLQQREVIPKDACRKCAFKKEQDIWGDEISRARRSTNKGNVTYNYNMVKDSLADEGYELLTPRSEYKTLESYIQYRCHNPKHPIVDVTAKAFMKGQRCRKCYFDSQKGSGSPRWKGGKRETKLFFRRCLDEWKQESLKKYNYQCAITHIEGYSEIHHIRSFVSILDEAFQKLGLEYCQYIGEYCNSDILKLMQEVQSIHSKNLGVPLYQPVHKLLHTHYGLDTTPEQYHEFLERCQRGDLKPEIDAMITGFKKDKNHKKEYAKIICVETKITYDSRADAERKTGYHAGGISKAIKTRKKYNGFHWMRKTEYDLLYK